MEKGEVNVFTYTWIIKNFSLCHYSLGESLCSPNFALHCLPGNTWHINLFPRGNKKADFISVCLTRNGNALENCDIKFSVEGQNCHRCLIFNFNEQMPGVIKTNCAWECSDAYKRDLLLSRLRNDILVIKLVLKPFLHSEPDVLPPLCYKNGRFADVVLRAGDVAFQVHKAVLYSRWPKLAKILDAEATSEKVLDIESDVLDAMIEYVYTGRLERGTDMLAKLYTVAAKYELPSFQCMNAMEVVMQKARTVINVEQVSFEWKIENFSNLPTGTKLLSHVFFVGMIKSCVWNLMLHIREATKSGIAFNVSLCNTYGSEPKPFFVKSKISIHDSHYAESAENEHLFHKSEKWICADLRKLLSCNASQSYPLLITESEFQRSMFYIRYGSQIQRENELERALQLKCEFKFSDCSSLSETIESSSAFALPTSLHYQQFSSDLGNLYKTGKLSDITITVGSKIFSVHKSIICSRSAVFCRMFETEMKESVRNSIDISDVDPDIMNEMLLYMYSGWLEKPLDDDRAEELYVVADKYEIFALKEKCSTFFKSRLSPSNVCQVLQLADLHSDDDLYKQVVKFFSEEWYIFLCTEEWQTFTVCNGSVATKVLQDVKKMKIKRKK